MCPLEIRLELTPGIGWIRYKDPSTWTDETKELQKRVTNGDFAAIAPLLETSLEFLRDPAVLKSLMVMKYHALFPETWARIELRKISNVFRRRPKSRKRKLPSGAALAFGLESLVGSIERNGLLALRKDRDALKKRMRKATKHLGASNSDAICAGMINGLYTGTGMVRRPRSWALNVLANHYRVL